MPARGALGWQDEEFDSMSLVDESSVFVPAPREILRPLFRAQKAIRQGNTERAVTMLGEIVSDPQPEDYLVKVPGEFGVVTSLRGRAIELLGQLPLKDRRTHQLRYGVQAKQLLDRALETGDVREMSMVMRRFYYTRAGYDAAMIVGHYHLDQGHPVAAAACFQKIVDTEEARSIHDPAVSVLLATCWMLAGSESKAVDVLNDLKRRQRNSFIEFHGKRVPIFGDNEAPAVWLKRLVGDSPLQINRWVNEWVMFRGNPQRNANSGSGFPLLRPRWTVPTHNHPQSEQLIENLQKEMIVGQTATIPSVQPIAVGNCVLMRTTNRLVGIDFETGKRTWVFPPWDKESFFRDQHDGLQSEPPRLNQNALSQRMWKDHLFGQVSSDGQNVFVVPAPGFASNSKLKVELGSGQWLDHPLSQRTYNELIAVEIARQGALKWEVGGETGLDEPKLAEAFFLGPPLPIDNSLLAVVQQAREIKLVALDAEDGSLLWSQQLASTETGGSVSSVAGRRLAGATPSYSDGLVICPTGVGAIVAVELATRSLAWGFQYGSAKNQRVARIMVNQTSADSRNNKGFLEDGAWRDSTITIAEGTVLFTPVDRQELLCLDLLTGRPRWKDGDSLAASIPRDDSLYLGCVVNGQIVLIGRDETRSVDLLTGAESWATATTDYGRPSGRGYSDREHYYLPTTNKRILKIQLTDGQIANVIETDRVLGNLISYRSDIISHGADHVAAYPSDESNRQRIAAAESRGEMTAELKAIKAQMLLQDGNLRDAANLFCEAYQMTGGTEYRATCFDLLTRLIRVDLDTGLEFAEPVRDELIAVKGNEFLAALADGCIRNGHWKRAFAAVSEIVTPVDQFMELGRDLITEVRSDQDARAVIGQESTIRASVWAKSRIEMILAQCDAEVRTAILSQLSDWINKTEFQSSLERLQVADMLGISHLSPETLDLLIKQLVAESNFAACQFLLGQANLESMLFTATRQSLVDENLPKTGQPEWKTGLVHTAVMPTFYDPNLTDYAETLNRNQLHLVELDDQPQLREFKYYYFYQSNEFQIIDQFGNEFARFSLSPIMDTTTRLSTYDEGELRIKGSLAVATIATNVFAFDWHRLLAGEDPVLWYRNTGQGSSTTSLSSSQSQNIWGHRQVKTARRAGIGAAQVTPASTSGIAIFNKDRLVCVDSITGEVRWQKDNLPIEAELFGNDTTVLFVDSKRRTVQHFDLFSGEEVRKVQLPVDFGSIWLKRGDHVLLTNKIGRSAADEPANGRQPENDTRPEKIVPMKVLSYFDLANNRADWTKEFHDNTDAAPLRQNQWLAMLDETGQLGILDIESGQFLAQLNIQLPAGETDFIQQIEMEEFESCFMIKLHASRARSTRFQASNGTYFRIIGSSTFWNGYLLGLRKTDFQPIWSQPARVQWFQANPNLPWASPVYLMYRRTDRYGGRTTARYKIQVVAFDNRTGKLLSNSLMPYYYLIDYRVTVDPDRQSIFFHGRDDKIRFRFSDEAPPPRPVAFLGEQNSMYFSVAPQTTFSNELTRREKEREELVKRLTEFQERELEEKRRAMKKLLDKQPD